MERNRRLNLSISTSFKLSHCFWHEMLDDIVFSILSTSEFTLNEWTMIRVRIHLKTKESEKDILSGIIHCNCHGSCLKVNTTAISSIHYYSIFGAISEPNASIAVSNRCELKHLTRAHSQKQSNAQQTQTKTQQLCSLCRVQITTKIMSVSWHSCVSPW